MADQPYDYCIVLAASKKYLYFCSMDVVKLSVAVSICYNLESLTCTLHNTHTSVMYLSVGDVCRQ